MYAQKLNGANFVTTKAGLTGISGAATTYTTGVTVPFSLLGKAYSKAAVSGGASPTTDAVTGAAITLAINKGTVVLWCWDASGNPKVVQGTTENLDASGLFINSAPQFPDLPDTLAPFAYHVLKNGATGSLFTFGTSNWNATGMTHAVQDILLLPTRPQIA